jgi:hypothetical protein
MAQVTQSLADLKTLTTGAALDAIATESELPQPKIDELGRAYAGPARAAEGGRVPDPRRPRRRA